VRGLVVALGNRKLFDATSIEDQDIQVPALRDLKTY